jgi:hypothetical protein
MRSSERFALIFAYIAHTTDHGTRGMIAGDASTLLGNDTLMGILARNMEIRVNSARLLIYGGL